jgi:hypothetical protein
MTLANLEKLKASSPKRLVLVLGDCLRDESQLEPFTESIAVLPPSFREMMKDASQWSETLCSGMLTVQWTPNPLCQRFEQ